MASDLDPHTRAAGEEAGRSFRRAGVSFEYVGDSHVGCICSEPRLYEFCQDVDGVTALANAVLRSGPEDPTFKWQPIRVENGVAWERAACPRSEDVYLRTTIEMPDVPASFANAVLFTSVRMAEELTLGLRSNDLVDVIDSATVVCRHILKAYKVWTIDATIMHAARRYPDGIELGVAAACTPVPEARTWRFDCPYMYCELSGVLARPSPPSGTTLVYFVRDSVNQRVPAFFRRMLSSQLLPLLSVFANKMQNVILEDYAQAVRRGGVLVTPAAAGLPNDVLYPRTFVGLERYVESVLRSRAAPELPSERHTVLHAEEGALQEIVDRSRLSYAGPEYPLDAARKLLLVMAPLLEASATALTERRTAIATLLRLAESERQRAALEAEREFLLRELEALRLGSGRPAAAAAAGRGQRPALAFAPAAGSVAPAFTAARAPLCAPPGGPPGGPPEGAASSDSSPSAPPPAPEPEGHAAGPAGEPAPRPRLAKLAPPPNAWILFYRQRRAEVGREATERGLDNNAIMRMLRAEWTEMDPELKAPFLREAERRRSELKEAHPELRFRRKSAKAREAEMAALKALYAGEGGAEEKAPSPKRRRARPLPAAARRATAATFHFDLKAEAAEQQEATAAGPLPIALADGAWVAAGVAGVPGAWAGWPAAWGAVPLGLNVPPALAQAPALLYALPR